MRLFVGIEFPGEIVDELLKVQNQIRSHAKRGRFVTRENLHLTLQFLGEVPSQEIGPVVEALRKTAQSHSAFSMTLKKVGDFRNGHTSRVIWVGIDGDMRNLTCMQKDLSVSLAPLGFLPEKRPYQPHITLGRDVEFIGEASFEKYIDTMEKLSFLVSRFSLIESKMENGKLMYHSLYSFPLVNFL
ncbi:RNA 2',3'-cyclic phosphodiesterase [Sporomusa sp.]|uniref:RNA 2',3'-cyclic phosphodiesterase n=1 Tax=Sporomusa sp. TaxID=2078658 RepID=UPI002C108DF6|nr:RNA 2',3'-cyclic phosphodiesterase [Sporomusa sp.]HWR42142.1 RNA 2',3'-cyclic phosphodiesterase [Sporomusa sp.]